MITKSELKSGGVKLTRAQISERAIEIAEMCVGGSYKNAVACVGRMVALSKAIDDAYWQEKFSLGAEMERYTLLHFDNNEHVDRFIKIS